MLYALWAIVLNIFTDMHTQMETRPGAVNKQSCMLFKLRSEYRAQFYLSSHLAENRETIETID